jgi:hypothetical protein
MLNFSDFANKADASSTYSQFLLDVGLNAEDFPFKLKTGRMHKGKEIIFTIRSWGGYESSKGLWLLFIAYYNPSMKHIVQYTWSYDENGLVFNKPNKHEWISG